VRRDRAAAAPRPGRACGGCADDGRGRLIADTAFEAFDCAVLEVMRHFFSSYAEPRSQRWETALDCAVGRFGEEAGPAVAMAALRVLRAMRASRRSCFSFNSPVCVDCRARVTDCERALIEAARAMRVGETDEARAWAAIVCEGAPVERLVDALIGLSVHAPASGSFAPSHRPARERLH